MLVVDTAGEADPTERVHAVLPEAHVHRLDHDPGYGGAANHVTDLVEGAAFYLFVLVKVRTHGNAYPPSQPAPA